MSRRELILAIATVAVLGIGLVLRFAPEGDTVEPVATQLETAGTFEGASPRRQLESSIAIIEQGPEIREAYRRVEAQFPERVGNRTPEATFSDELTRMMKEQGWERPKIRPPQTTEIPEVDDYYYIDLEVQVTGELQEALNLLSAFQNKGLLIKAFDITNTNPDQQVVSMDVTVSRLARIDDAGRRRLRG